MTWLIDMASNGASAGVRKIAERAAYGSIGPEKRIAMRGLTLKPSSWFSAAISAQVDGCALQSGSGRFTRSPVACVASGTVSASFGNRLTTVTSAAQVRGAQRRISVLRGFIIRRQNRLSGDGKTRRRLQRT